MTLERFHKTHKLVCLLMCNAAAEANISIEIKMAKFILNTKHKGYAGEYMRKSILNKPSDKNPAPERLS